MSISAYPAQALTLTENRSVTITAVVPGGPPTIPAIIDSPLNGETVTATPLVVTGTCEVGLRVEIYNFGALAGTGTCSAQGTFTINIGLLEGLNSLTALNFDSFDQSGPISPTVSVYVKSPNVDPVTHPDSPQTDLLSTDREDQSNPLQEERNSVIRFGVLLGFDFDGSQPITFVEQFIYWIIILLLLFILIDSTFFNSQSVKNFLQVGSKQRKSKK